MTIAQDAFKAPGARIVVAAIARPTDPSNGDAEVPVYLSDSELWTEGAEAEANKRFLSLMSEGGAPSYDESLTSPGQLTGDGEYTVGRIVVDLNADIAELWRGLQWNGKEIKLYVGAERKADGSRMQFSDFDLLVDGLVDKARPVGKGQWEIKFADPRVDYDKPLEQEIYQGFGGGFQVRGNNLSDRWLFQSHDVAMDVTGAMTIYWIGEIAEFRSPSVSGAHCPLLMNGRNGLDTNPPSMNYGLFLDDSGEIYFGGGLNPFNVSEFLGSGHTVPLGEAVIAATVDSSGTGVTFYAGTNASDLAPVGSGTLSNALEAGPTYGIQSGQLTGHNWTVWSMGILTEEATFEDLQDIAEAPITDALSRAEVLEVWRFEEGTLLGLGPEYIFGEKDVLDFQITGDGFVPSPVLAKNWWVTTYTGDGPDVFQGSVAGQRRARCYGLPFNVPLHRIDSQRHTYGWDHEESDDLLRLRANGQPMVPGWGLLTSSLGDVESDATAGTITINNPAVGSFYKLIEGQESPSRLGQRIEVIAPSSGPEDGIYRVHEVSDDNLVVTLGDSGIVTKSFAAGTVVRSYVQEYQYDEDLTNSAVKLGSRPLGAISGDPVGRLPSSGTAYCSDLVELFVGATPDVTNLSFDPEIAFYLKPDDPLTVNGVLGQIARSCYGYIILTGDGDWVMGNFTPPSGTPLATIDPGRLISVEPAGEPLNPFWRFNVGYRRNWSPLEPGSLAGSLSDADRQLLTSPYTYEQSTDRTVLSAYPTATEHPGFNTWLVHKEDAITFKGLARAMVGLERQWYTLRFASLWPLDIPIGAVLELTWDDLTMGLDATLCRVTSRRIDLAKKTMDLEVYT